MHRTPLARFLLFIITDGKADGWYSFHDSYDSLADARSAFCAAIDSRQWGFPREWPESCQIVDSRSGSVVLRATTRTITTHAPAIKWRSDQSDAAEAV